MKQSGEPTVRHNRAQVGPVGIVLVVFLVLAGSTAVVVLGATAVGQSRDTLSEQRAEKAMTQFDSKAALVALGNSDTQQVDFGTDRRSGYEVNEDEGWMRIIVENQTGGTTTEVVNESLGTMTYEVGNRTIAYQSGGVWKRVEDNESLMISPPEFYFRGGTLTLPVVNVTGAASVGSTASITHEETIEKYPDSSDNGNPLRNHLVKVSVRSKYYKGWGRYFEERTDGDVEYDHARNVVNLTLVSPVGLRRITAATSSLSASGSFELRGSARSDCPDDGDVQNGGDEMYTNSYNSSRSGDYCDQADMGGYGHEGDIIYGEDINISYGSGGSWIHGDVESGGNVTVSGSAGSGQAAVYGNIRYTDSCNPSVTDCQARVENTSSSVDEIDGIPTERQIDYYVDHEIDDIEENGNPGGAPIDSNDRLQFSSGDVELTSGRYILEKIDPSAGDEITLNTTDGTVVVAVREDVSIPDDVNITVEGDGNALMFVGNESSSDQWAFDMAKGSAVRNDGDEADQFRLYGKENMNVRVGDGGGGGNTAKFVGVIYTPPGNDGNGTVVLNKGEVFGGIVTGTTVIESSGGAIHYDKALRKKQVIKPDANVLKVTYLHVSVNRIRVD